MLNHHLFTAWRSIMNRKLNSLISVVGLAIGLTVTLLILSFVRHEAGFDSMHRDTDRVYRLNWNSGEGTRFATFFNPVSETLATAVPEIEDFARIGMSEQLVTIDGEVLIETVSLVDPQFFDFFSYNTLAGDLESAIQDLGSVVLTEAAAFELFGNTRPIGEVMTIDGRIDLRVAAIISNNPGNSHLVSNIYTSMEGLTEVWDRPQFWENTGSDVLYHYVRIAPGVSAEQVERNGQAFLDENVFPGSNASIALQPLRDIHFETDLQNAMSIQDDITGVVKSPRQRTDIFIFSAVALLTLAIAAFNFTNLQAVQVLKRAREIGVKRTLGSGQRELMAQFWIETTVMALLAFLLATVLCELAMPVFYSVLGVTITPATVFTAGNLGFLLGSSLVVGLLAGAYPALIAARVPAVVALQGNVYKGSGKNKVRSSLIVVQFGISIGLMIASGIIYTQINYAMSKSLGFDPGNVVVVELPNNTARSAYGTMREELLTNPSVISVSGGSVIPTRDLSDGTVLVPEGGDPNNPVALRTIAVSDDYFSTLGMDIVAGRALDDDYPSDPSTGYTFEITRIEENIVVNETAARRLGYDNPQEIIGQRFYNEGPFRGVIYRSDMTVVGVVRDAHYQSVRSEIASISYSLVPRQNTMVIKLAGDDAAGALSMIDRIWSEQVPEFPIQRSFLADSYSAFYTEENNTFKLFIVLSVIAVIIASLGLYSLASYIAERRSKEISIRKVLGATVQGLAGLLAWDFSRLVLIANLLAWPLAWWAMQQWLSNFAYKTEISLAIFIIAGLGAFLIALLSTFQRAYSVAVANPVDALRLE